MLNIEPIKLLYGSHDDTAQTGSGCFMNVIAYLNGEAQITDSSPCVCPTIRPIAIWLNDYLEHEERNVLLPYVQRAMGTATEDRKIIRQRLELVVSFANKMAILAKEFSADIADAYDAYAAESAAFAATAAAAYTATAAARSVAAARSAARSVAAARSAAESASCAAEAAYHSGFENRKQIIEAAMQFMDAVCPTASLPAPIVIERANKLIELAKA